MFIKLNYQKKSNGEKILIIFPGYEQDFSEYKFVFKFFKDYTIYFFNYNFLKRKDFVLNKDNFFLIFNNFLNNEKINYFTLLAYSLGGKFALVIIELFSKKINKTILLAPDGLKVNLFYYFISHTKLGKYFYQKFIQNPAFFYKIIKILKVTGIISSKLEDFVLMHTESKEKREKVFLIWNALKDFYPDIKLIKKNILTNNFILIMVFGKYDKIIPHKHLKKIIDKSTKDLLNKRIFFKILNKVHNLIKEEVFVEIIK